jgi:hypothetical protein
MNYNRRANRPDGGHYRQMRRRGLKGSDEGVSFRRGGLRTGAKAVLVMILLGAAVAGWMMWR